MDVAELFLVLCLIGMIFGAGYWVGDHAAARRAKESELEGSIEGTDANVSDHDDEIKKVESAIADLQQWRAAEMAKKEKKKT